ncbi:DUF2528 family protein [Xanthomonas campestris pv. trichodesmae]|uniref:DUF2528 domain-containing protein n=2 Tax=Xanthomonas citri TaxID=346 RepID=A0AB33CEU7_XANCI|nr:DUF2528 family protein [Xanthomonas citri]ASK91084.1 hypothetical protein XcvCFBP7111P_05825 [Xanthomonas citri pv. vignicola]MBV6779244.1 DUF2528 family protein [Xanthomonas campestris pv. trichodesmae]MBZ3921758.1 hypothetical protein [Xanthomonas campestris pv. trichodesmae]MBZ3926358.1 hypothetical protein [Xanthomonas citri pv. sesbaniae]
MAMTKRYQVTEDRYDLEVMLQVDHDLLTPERATEINSFWTDADERLDAADGDVVRAVILMAARRFMFGILEDTWAGVRGMQQDFDEAEGWGGSAWNGITLIEFDGAPQIELEDMALEEVEG